MEATGRRQRGNRAAAEASKKEVASPRGIGATRTNIAQRKKRATTRPQAN